MTQIVMAIWLAQPLTSSMRQWTVALVLLFAGLLVYIGVLRGKLRARAERLEVMNAITNSAVMAVDVRTHGRVTLEAMKELCRLNGAQFSWFQQVEDGELVLRQQLGLPDWFASKHGRTPICDNAGVLVQDDSQTIEVESLPAGLRGDLEQIGIHFILAVPVVGKTARVGVLSFGLTGRRSFAAEQLCFLTAVAKQLGITGESLRMMERVSNSQREWLATIDSINDCILVHDAEPRVLRLNRALAHRLNRPLLELAGKPLAQVLPNAKLGCPYCKWVLQNTVEGEDPCFGGYATVSTAPLAEDQAGKTGTVHIIRDRTMQRTGEERYRLLFQSVQEAVFVTTPEGKLLDCNPAFASILGYLNPAELLDIDVGKDLFVSEEQRAAYTKEMEKNGCLRNYEIALRRKDGRIITLLENSFASRDADGRLLQYQGFLVDFTEKKRVEDDMQRRNRELVALNAMASIATRTFDLDEILQNTLSWTTELFGQHCDILLFDLDSGHVMRSESSRENQDKARDELRGLVEQELNEFIAHTQGEFVTELDLPELPKAAQAWIGERGYESFIAVKMHSQRKTMGILLVTSQNRNQFTETDQNLAIAIARQLGNAVEKVLLYEETALAYNNLRNAQEQLLQSEKMSAIGQLISGVAHELNNPLTAILGYAQLLETEPIGERAQDYVRKLYLQTQRTHRVVQNLLSFSRQRKPIHSQVDLRQVMEDTFSLREFDLKLNNVHTERSYDPAVPFIKGDAHQLEQVFLNIINNAVDAIMDSGRAGSLKVRIYARDHQVCVEFRDSGPGLKDPSKIFDPFYTTKKLGKGTGLGLSICYGIVKEHGGEIVAFNHVQGGAVFQLKLPVAGPQKS